jgi:hypothetical protein
MGCRTAPAIQTVLDVQDGVGKSVNVRSLNETAKPLMLQ